MNQRIECTFWICLALLVLVWGTVFSAGWGIPFAVLGMMVFAAYDFYEQKKNQPIQENDLLESVQCMSPNRFFAAQVIVFVMALTWLDFATGLTALVFFNIDVFWRGSLIYYLIHLIIKSEVVKQVNLAF